VADQRHFLDQVARRRLEVRDDALVVLHILDDAAPLRDGNE
jgi:hypothetical protein